MDRSHIDYRAFAELKERVRLAETLILELSEHLAAANALIAKLTDDQTHNADSDTVPLEDSISAE